MLTRTSAFARAAERDGAKVSALVRIVTTSLAAQLRNVPDWDGGTQQGTPGSDFPATTLTVALTNTATTASVANAADFSIPDGRTDGMSVGYLYVIDGATFQVEIISYTGMTSTSFTGLTRGLYNTTPIAHLLGSWVYQLEFTDSAGASFDLGLQPRGWWQPVSTGGPPAARQNHTLVWDTQNNRVILFGGKDGSQNYGDIWLFDPASHIWTQRTPAGGPSARYQHTAVWDSIRNVMIMYGGTTSGPNPGLADTWEYDPNAGAQGTWTQRDNCPQARFEHAACFDAASGLMYAVVGKLTNSTYSRKAYAYDGAAAPGSQWTQVATGGPNMQCSGGALAPIDGVMYFGGILLNAGQRVRSFNLNSHLWNDPFKPAVPPYSGTATTAFTTDPVSGSLIASTARSTYTSGTRLYQYVPGANSWVRWVNFSRELRYTTAMCWDTVRDEALLWGGTTSSISFAAPVYDDPAHFRYYAADMTWRSNTMDIGATPNTDGKVTMDDTQPNTGAPSTAYSLEYSDDGAAWTVLGPVANGDVLTERRRYWRATATMTTNTDATPAVQRIRVAFDITATFCLADTPVFGYPPVVKSLPALSSKIDLLKGAASISSLKVDILNAGSLATDLIRNGYIYNKDVVLLLGFDEPGFTEEDYLPYLTGVVKEWTYDGHVLTIVTHDGLEMLKTNVPADVNDGLPTPIVYNASGTSHPIAIQRDLLQNHININDERLDLDSFDTVAADASLAGWTFLRTVSDPTEGKKLIEEISRLTGALVIPSEDGRLRCALYDPSGSAVAAWDERDIIEGSARFIWKAEHLKNFIAVYYDVQTGADGEKPTDYNGAVVNSDADSITQWNRTAVERILGVWLGPDDATYDGKTRATDIASRVLTRFMHAVPMVTLDTTLDWLHVQVGDLVRLRGGVLKDGYTAPYVAQGIDAVRDLKFQVVRKNVNVKKRAIAWTLWRAQQALAVDIDAETDWETGAADMVNISTSATPGSIELDDVALAAGTYTLRVSLDQQPERDGTCTIDATLPSGTAVTAELFGSHTGAWAGEEIRIGALTLNATQPMAFKYRHYTALFTLTGNGANTPTVDRFRLNFDG